MRVILGYLRLNVYVNHRGVVVVGRDGAGMREMAEQTNGKELADRAAVAEYLASMTADLAAMAREHGLATLAHILEMARLEAENAARQPNDPD
jgi:hypothetical protein